MANGQGLRVVDVGQRGPLNYQDILRQEKKKGIMLTATVRLSKSDACEILNVFKILVEPPLQVVS